MSNADKKKLDGIASGAEVNQNAFANVKVGSTTIQSDAKQDTLELAAGTNISLVGDANNDKVTIGVTGKVASASQADNATNATKATQDKNGLQIDTNYLKLSGGTMNGTLNISKTTNTYLAGNQGQAIINSTASNGAYTMLAKMNSSNGKFTHGVYQGDYLLQYTNNTTISAGTNAVTKSVTLLDESGNTNFSGTVTAPSFNGTATKATQDSAGQTINTTYVKGVTANNATLTITKGNGSTSTTTVNNVSNATNANNLVISGTSAHIKYGGGDVDENTAISQNKVNLLIGSWYSTGFRDLCSSGTPIRVAINHRNGNIKTTGNVTANGAMYSATPGTSDNSTRVATTAFVQSLINSLKGSIGGAIVASNLAQNGYVKFSNGLILQWGLSNDIRTTTGTTISLPISFSNSAYIGLVTICRGNSLSRGVLSSYISNLTTTNFYLYFDKTGDDTTNKIYWFVIGK